MEQLLIVDLHSVGLASRENRDAACMKGALFLGMVDVVVLLDLFHLAAVVTVVDIDELCHAAVLGELVAC